MIEQTHNDKNLSQFELAANSKKGKALPKAEQTAPVSDSEHPASFLSTFAKALRNWRIPILGAGACGALLGIGIAAATTDIYRASSQLEIINPQLPILADQNYIDIAERLSQYQTAALDGNGVPSSGVTFFKFLTSNENPAFSGQRAAVENLKTAINIQSPTSSDRYILNVDASEPLFAADLANIFARNIVTSQNDKQAGAPRDITLAKNPQLLQLKNALFDAEERATIFALENNIERSVDLRAQENAELNEKSELLAQAQNDIASAKYLADAAKDASWQDAADGVLEASLVSPALKTLRNEYAVLSLNLETLQEALGPRHPRLIEANSAFAAAQDKIETELKNIVAQTQNNLRLAISQEQEIATQISDLKADPAIAKLRGLEAEINSAKALYDSAVQQASENGDLEKPSALNAKIITDAVAPTKPNGLSDISIVVMTTLLGLLSALALAFISTMRSYIAHRSEQQKNKSEIQPKTEPPLTTASEPNSNQTKSPKRETEMYAGMQQYPFASNPQYPYQQQNSVPMQPANPQAQSPQAQSPHAQSLINYLAARRQQQPAAPMPISMTMPMQTATPHMQPQPQPQMQPQAEYHMPVTPMHTPAPQPAPQIIYQQAHMPVAYQQPMHPPYPHPFNYPPAYMTPPAPLPAPAPAAAAPQPIYIPIPVPMHNFFGQMSAETAPRAEIEMQPSAPVQRHSPVATVEEDQLLRFKGPRLAYSADSAAVNDNDMDASELEYLRESIDEIRTLIDHLSQTRRTKRHFG